MSQQVESAAAHVKLFTNYFRDETTSFARALLLCTMAGTVYGRAQFMDSLSTHSSSSSLPGLALGTWDGTAPAVSTPMPLPAQPFTLWLSPDAWPKPALRLPGNAYTLWQNPNTWPRLKIRLQGNAHTLWMNASARPLSAVPAPGALEEPLITSGNETFVESKPGPVVEVIALPAAVIEPESMPAFPSLDPVAALTPEPTPPSVPEPVTTMIKLPANHSFTLWTTPAALSQASKLTRPAVSGKATLRLQGQPFTLWTQPGRVERIVMRNAAAPVAGKVVTIAPATPVSTGRRWLPMAACIAVATLFGAGYISQKSQRVQAEDNYAQLQIQAAAEASTAQVQILAANTKAEDALSKLMATEKDLQGEIASLKTGLVKAEKASESAQKAVLSTTSALEKTTKELSEAKTKFAARETELQSSLTTLTEESSKAKRLYGEEMSKARETIAKLEEEMAAAIKSTTAAMEERDVIRAEVEKLRKQLESPAKPPGTPDA